MKKEIVSVVILIYNSSQTIEKCLQSLREQTNKNFEVLIIDDDSTDNTLELIRNSKPKLTFKIKYFRNGKHNISRGRNIGIKNAKTKYVAFIDSDAYADKNWIKNIISAFHNDKELTLVGGKEIPIYTSKFSKGNSLNDGAINRLTSNFWTIRGCNFAINKDNVDKEMFNENFLHNEETEFITRLNKNDKKYALKKDIIVYHESRNAPEKYLKQMYKYGIWRVFFSFNSKKFRIIDFYPSLLILLTVLLFPFNFFVLLLIPFISLIETIFVLLYMKSRLEFFPYVYLGWIIKNIAWGLGTFIGLTQVLLHSETIQRLKEE